MAKVTFEDKVALNENADIPNINKCMASDLNELKAGVNALYDDKNILSAKLESDFVITPNEYVEISNWTENIKIGNKLNVENGKIKIGAGVSAIKIVGQFGVLTNSDTERYYFYTKKNGESIGTWVVFDTKNSYMSVPFTQMLNVAENDIISVAIYGSSNANSIEKHKTTFILETVG